MSINDKVVLTTKECHHYCGSEAIFEELEAVYGSKLRPLRTTANHSRTWSKVVVQGIVNLAQSEGILNDRPRVEKALEQLRASKRPKLQEVGL